MKELGPSQQIQAKIMSATSDDNIVELGKLIGTYLKEVGNRLITTTVPHHILDRVQHISRELSFYNFFLSIFYGQKTGYKAKLLQYIRDIIPQTSPERLNLYERWCSYVENDLYDKLKEEAWIFGGLDEIEAPSRARPVADYGGDDEEEEAHLGDIE